MTTVDTAYLAIIDGLEAEVKTLEMTLDGVKALYEQRIAALEVELKASRGWWKRLRVAEIRITALEAAARDLLKTARVGYTLAIKTRQDDGLVSEMVTSCEQMAALLEKDV